MTSPTRFVRPAVTADLPAIASAWRHYMEEMTSATVPQDEAAVMSSLRAALHANAPGNLFLVAVDAGRVVGFALTVALTPPTATPGADLMRLAAHADMEILFVVVDPGCAERDGHAARLMAAVVDLAREEKVTIARTWIPERDTVWATLAPAAGFREVGLRQSWTEAHTSTRLYVALL